MLIDESGRIAAVGPAASVPLPENAEAIQLDDAVLLPGLVNVHTHLELTGFAPTSPDLPFDKWILDIRRKKLACTGEQYLEAARRGLLECWRGGVTTVADTGDSGAVIQALHEAGGSGVAYHEVFGPHPLQLDESFSGLVRRVDELSGYQNPRVRLGVSPHAPYTVSGPLYARVAEFARSRKLPVAVHLAESKAEWDFVTEGTGPFAEAWRSRRIPLLDDPTQQPDRLTARPPDGLTVRTPAQWLATTGILGPSTLAIHMVQLSPEDLALLADSRVRVAHCPVSNQAHRHGAAPLAALLQAGLRVGLGTDSASSVGALDLFREARAAQALARLTDLEALELATLDGARALDLDSELGSLELGKWGDVIAVRFRGQGEDPAAAALHSAPDEVMLTVLGGRIRHRLTARLETPPHRR